MSQREYPRQTPREARQGHARGGKVSDVIFDLTKDREATFFFTGIDTSSKVLLEAPCGIVVKFHKASQKNNSEVAPAAMPEALVGSRQIIRRISHRVTFVHGVQTALSYSGTSVDEMGR